MAITAIGIRSEPAGFVINQRAANLPSHIFAIYENSVGRRGAIGSSPSAFGGACGIISVPAFRLFQRALGRLPPAVEAVPIVFYAFAGLRRLPIRERRRSLEPLVARWKGAIQLSVQTGSTPQ